LANQAGAQQARAAIGDRIIRAPFSGQVSLRTVSPGAVVSAGTPIAIIADTSVIKLDFTIPETALSALAEGQAIIATAAARPGQPFEGKIATIEPRVDPVTRAVRVRALLPNRDGALLPGMLMSVVVETQPRMALAVPELAVVGEADRRYIFVLDEENKAKRTEIEIGTRDAGLIEVKGGLKEGQRVVGEGLVKVSDGMKVRVEGDEPAAAPSGGRAPQPGGRSAPAGNR
jgi:membrane fusion protein (multidrug efflux system)